MRRKSKIFLSYSYSDKGGVLDKFIRDLEQSNSLSVWTAEQQLTAGSRIVETIHKAISDSDYFIQIASFQKSKWLNNEMQIAYSEELKNQNLKIITVILNDLGTSERILGIGSRGIVLNFGSNYQGGFKSLMDYINLNSSDNLANFSLDTSINKQTIIGISSRVNDKLIAHFSNHPEKLKVIDRRLFEEVIAELFYGFGFDIELTQQTRDGGRDIIAIKNDETQLKYLIECKRPDPGNVVGIRPVRELFGVKQDEKATKAILATTTYFSKDALMFFERNKWELESKDFNDIMKWIHDYNLR